METLADEFRALKAQSEVAGGTLPPGVRSDSGRRDRHRQGTRHRRRHQHHERQPWPGMNERIQEQIIDLALIERHARGPGALPAGRRADCAGRADEGASAYAERRRREEPDRRRWWTLTFRFPPMRPLRRLRSDRAFVLVMTVLVLSILVVLGYAFSYSAGRVRQHGAQRARRLAAGMRGGVRAEQGDGHAPRQRRRRQVRFARPALGCGRSLCPDRSGKRADQHRGREPQAERESRRLCAGRSDARTRTCATRSSASSRPPAEAEAISTPSARG